MSEIDKAIVARMHDALWNDDRGKYAGLDEAEVSAIVAQEIRDEAVAEERQRWHRACAMTVLASDAPDTYRRVTPTPEPCEPNSPGDPFATWREAGA